MTTFEIVLILLIIACCLLGFGFNFRQHNWGIAIMWLGAITMLSAIAYKIYDVTQIVG
ncbi:hypothetical protein [Entomomonas asaccharolytica]|uniref:Uncharacterized protein n=1 Tax=Entomomonas asaccharolytica TaxID=2785331 RepID=A0A974NHS8_9GAMM|nr:hypothetical protein [Entomomonas asaccharolytica]QQP86709.1 hypothetical protein JHT90_05580 [Entomomonas asaccharolytica]